MVLEYMTTTTTAISIFDRIVKILSSVKSGKIKRDEQVDRALKDTHNALIETQSYVRISEIQKDRERERKIAKSWYDASISMRHVDNELAQILSYKGGYWSNPEAWDDIRSGGLDISIEKVEKLASELLSDR